MLEKSEYITSYEENVGEQFSADQEIIATIHQTYILDEEHKIVQIITDLSEYDRCVSKALGLSESDSESKTESHIVNLYLTNYDHPTEFVIPE